MSFDVSCTSRIATRAIAFLGLFWVSTASVVAGPFSPAGGQPGSIAVLHTDSIISSWASSVVDFAPGPIELGDPSAPPVSFGAPGAALGMAEGNGTAVVSLGDGGSITLGFASGIRDRDGYDFAVFENGFSFGSDSFLELGFVEVSSNGSDFFRFDATSLTQTATQVGAFNPLDSTDLNNLAGSFTAGFGTPFDLAELAGVSPLLDVEAVRFVRIVDVVGSIDPTLGSFDAQGNLINDPFATPFASGGFDLDGIGVINAIPEPGTAALLALGATLILAARIRFRS